MALAKRHKDIEEKAGNWRCVDCMHSGRHLQSDHVLPASKFKLSRLWLRNLELRCGPCNQKKGVYIILTPKTITLLILYFVVWFMRWTIAFSVLTLSFLHREDLAVAAEVIFDSPLFRSLCDFLSEEYERLAQGSAQPESGESAFSQSSYEDHSYVPE